MQMKNKIRFVKIFLISTGSLTAFTLDASANESNKSDEQTSTTYSTPASAKNRTANTTTITSDLLGGLGYSNWKMDDSNFSGYNLNFSALFHGSSNDPIKFVFGPSIKYENVESEEDVTPLIKGNATISTLQLGVEGGIKISINPLFNLYTTLFGSYGIVNESEIKLSSGGQSVTGHPSIDKNWQLGAQVRGVFNLNEHFGLGAGLALGRGHLNTGDYTFIGQKIKGDSDKYTLVSANVLAAVYL